MDVRDPQRIARDAASDPPAGAESSGGERARSLAHGIRAGIVAFGMALLAALWGGVLFQLDRDEHLVLLNAERDTSNFAIAFEEHIVRTLKAIDQATAHFQVEFERERGPFDFAAWLKANSALRDVALQVAVIDEDADVLWSSIAPVLGRVDLSDREHIKIHFERDTGALFIGKPVIGRVSGQSSINLSRRLNKPDGSFGGAVVVSLDPSYLASFYRSIDIGQHGAVTVVGHDGIVRARASYNIGPIGQNLSQSRLFQEIARSPQGSYRNVSVVDGIDRIFSYRTVRDYPLHLLVGIAVNDALEEFKGTRGAYMMATGLISLVLVAMLFLLFRQATVLQRLTRDLRLKERELVASKEAAEQASRAKSAFLASMSHELRTPLNAIMGFAEVIQAPTAAPSSKSEHVDYARHIHESGEHLLRIINDILDMSKIEAGRLELNEDTLDLRSTVEACLRLISARAAAASLRIETDIPADCPALLVDGLRLRQILLNLLTNAVKFTPGPGVVSVLAAPTPSGGLAISVADTGIGMTAEEIKLAMQPFRQIDNRLARKYAGTGLGLPLVKSLVEMHRGEFRLNSMPGEGTTATIVLPPERLMRHLKNPAAHATDGKTAA